MQAAEITGSIAAPQTTAPLPVPAASGARCRANRRVRMPVVPGWTIRDTRNGYVYVENHGEIYQVSSARRCPASARCNRSSGRTAAGWC